MHPMIEKYRKMEVAFRCDVMKGEELGCMQCMKIDEGWKKRLVGVCNKFGIDKKKLSKLVCEGEERPEGLRYRSGRFYSKKGCLEMQYILKHAAEILPE